MAYASLNANRDPRNGLYKITDYKSTIPPFKPKVYVEPKKYVDPMTIKPRKFEIKEFKPSKFKPTKFDPYLELLPYQLPKIDPLTGRPYPPRKRGNKVDPEQQDKKKKKRVIKPLVFLPNGELETETNTDSSFRLSDSTNLPVIDKTVKRTVNEYIIMMSSLKQRQKKAESREMLEVLDF